jgi:hypothetical protein
LGKSEDLSVFEINRFLFDIVCPCNNFLRVSSAKLLSLRLSDFRRILPISKRKVIFASVSVGKKRFAALYGGQNDNKSDR